MNMSAEANRRVLEATRRAGDAVAGRAATKLRDEHGPHWLRRVNHERASRGASPGRGLHEPLFALECVAWDPALRRAFTRRVKESAEQLVELRETIVHNGVVEVSEEELARAEALARAIVVGVRRRHRLITVRGPLLLLVVVLAGGGVAADLLIRSPPHGSGATASERIALAASLSNLGVNPTAVGRCQASKGGWSYLCSAQSVSVGIAGTASAAARQTRFTAYVGASGRRPCSPVSRWVGTQGAGSVRCVAGPGKQRALVWTIAAVNSVGAISAPTARYMIVRRVFHTLLGVANAH